MATSSVQLTEPEMKLLQTLVYQECGMYFDERRAHFLQDRLQRRLKACRLDSFYSYYRLLTSREGRVQHVYLDAVTGLEARIVSDSPMGKLEQELSDYRDVSGIKVPFSIRNLVNGAVRAEITVDKVEINPNIDDAIFRMGK